MVSKASSGGPLEGMVPLGRAQRRRLLHRDQMLDAAEELFAQQSYGAVRVEDIAAAADLAVGTIYTNFGNKDGLFLAVAERALDRTEEYLTRAVMEIADPLQRLVATGKAYIELLMDSPSLALFLVSGTTFPEDQDILVKVRARVQWFYGGLAKKIDTCVAAGILAPVDSQSLAVFIIGAWTGLLAVARNPATPELTPESAREILRQATQIMIAGLLITPASGAEKL